jgi:group I intron endonuclease
MGQCGIYKITNLLNGRIYIGSSINIKKRENQHFGKLNKNKHDNQFLQNDYNKCGEDNFKFEIILETDCEELLFDFEQNYLDEYYDKQKQCYNINPIAAKPPSSKGRKHSEETKKKISEGNKGKTLSEDHKRKLFEANVNKPRSEDTRNKISESLTGEKNHWFGKHHSKKTKTKISASMKGNNHPMFGKHFSEEHKNKLSESQKKKSFKLKSPFGEIFEFVGVNNFSRKHGLFATNISKLLLGKLYSYKGWTRAD